MLSPLPFCLLEQPWCFPMWPRRTSCASCFWGSVSINFFLCDNHFHVCVSYCASVKQNLGPFQYNRAPFSAWALVPSALTLWGESTRSRRACSSPPLAGTDPSQQVVSGPQVSTRDCGMLFSWTTEKKGSLWPHEVSQGGCFHPFKNPFLVNKSEKIKD